jgi:hypothetical protein
MLGLHPKMLGCCRSLDVRDPLGAMRPRLALVGPPLTSLRGLMNPPGSFSRESVREPSNYEKVDSFNSKSSRVCQIKKALGNRVLHSQCVTKGSMGQSVGPPI